MKLDISRRSFLARSATFGGLSIAAATVPWARVAMGSPGKGTDLFATINRPANPDKLTPTEAKHVPVITAPRRVHPGKVFTMKIKVGSVTHVMNPSHWITEVVLLTMEGNPVAHVELSPLVAEPVALFHLALKEPMGFRVQERCNLHGLWEAEHTITVG